jgi:hypothetical protein
VEVLITSTSAPSADRQIEITPISSGALVALKRYFNKTNWFDIFFDIFKDAMPKSTTGKS